MSWIHPLILCATLTWLPIFCALAPEKPYASGPVRLADTATLYHEANPESDTIRLALLINDSSLAIESPAWLGMGISEPSSGSMIGADIVTAQFAAGASANCTLVDRYVPFFAYPLGVGNSTNPPVFPLPDDCTESDWELVTCVREFDSGMALLEVVRSLSVADSKQDRAIEAGRNAFIHAYGGSFDYHGSSRHSSEVVFYEDEEFPSPSLDLPGDVDGSMLIIATNYIVPDDRNTIYACTSFEVPGVIDSPRMIVAVEPTFEGTASPMIHHFTLFLCADEEYAKQTAKTIACDLKKPFGPSGNTDARCSTFVYGYEKGAGRLLLPPDVGILTGGKRRFLVMQTHFDNPDLLSNQVDRSGVRVHYANTPRKHLAGSLLLGDPFVSRAPAIVRSDINYQHSCPSECTERFSEPITVFRSFLHMHTTGREIYTNLYERNESFVTTVSSVNFWSNRFQKIAPLAKSFVLKPGQQLQTVCQYDTSKRPETKFGVSTLDEMCMNFVLYWPVQVDKITGHEINTCAYFENGSGNESTTLCGDNGRIEDPFDDSGKFANATNPTLIDSVGAPTEFGKNGSECVAPSSEPTNSFGTGTGGDIITPSQALESDIPMPTQTVGSDVLTPTKALESNVPTPTQTLESDVPTPTQTFESGDPTPTQSLESDNPENSCFPASATVQLRDGRHIRMEKLNIGEEVLSKNGKFSSVFMFTHADRHVVHRFVRLSTEEGTAITLSAGHFLYVSGSLRRAGDVRKFDELRIRDDRKAVVTRIEWVQEVGLYNPQTLDGDIVVNEVLSSTFTEAIQPFTAMALLAPIRMAFSFFGMDASCQIPSP